MSIVISATLVKTLRERTGAGMMECKRALLENQGDIEKAVEFMRKSGQAKADKKSDRLASEGVIVATVSDNQRSAVLLEVNCETDFVARDENFIHFAKTAAHQLLTAQIADITQIATITNLEASRKSLIATIGENIQIRRYVYKTTQHALFSYVHANRIGVLVELENASSALGKDIGMSIVANHPLFIQHSDVPATLLNQEKEIFMAQALKTDKPKQLLEKMVDGRLKKFLDEICLLNQPFVKNPEQTISALLAHEQSTVHSFVRFALGEGIEKKTENFAEEVMKQVQSSL